MKGVIPRVEVERARMPAAELKKVVQESPKGHGARWKSGRVCGVELVAAGQDQSRTAQAARAVSAVAGADEEESEGREQSGRRSRLAAGSDLHVASWTLSSFGTGARAGAGHIVAGSGDLRLDRSDPWGNCPLSNRGSEGAKAWRGKVGDSARDHG